MELRVGRRGVHFGRDSIFTICCGASFCHSVPPSLCVAWPRSEAILRITNVIKPPNSLDKDVLKFRNELLGHVLLILTPFEGWVSTAIVNPHRPR